MTRVGSYGPTAEAYVWKYIRSTASYWKMADFTTVPLYYTEYIHAYAVGVRLRVVYTGKNAYNTCIVRKVPYFLGKTSPKCENNHENSIL
jgi:hypothetical protein